MVGSLSRNIKLWQAREDDCEWEARFSPSFPEGRGDTEYHEAENSAFQVIYSISSDLRNLASRRIWVMGICLNEAGGFLQIRLP